MRTHTHTRKQGLSLVKAAWLVSLSRLEEFKHLLRECSHLQRQHRSYFQVNTHTAELTHLWNVSGSGFEVCFKGKSFFFKDHHICHWWKIYFSGEILVTMFHPEWRFQGFGRLAPFTSIVKNANWASWFYPEDSKWVLRRTLPDRGQKKVDKSSPVQQITRSVSHLASPEHYNNFTCLAG